MSLKSQIDEDLKKAMLAKDKDALRALRGIKSLILLEETKEGGTGEISKEDEIRLLSKAAKQRKDSAEIYKAQNREDLLKTELDELVIIERYLPKQLSQEELTEKIKSIIEKMGVSNPSEMGKVIGAANKELAGQAEGKMIAETVKSLLAKS